MTSSSDRLMSSDNSDLPTPSTVDKGKRRADVPTERTPLLRNGSYNESTSRDILLYTTPPSSRHRLRSILTTIFLVSLSVCLIFAIFFAFLAWSYASRASRLVPDRLLNDDVVLSGPFRVDVLNATNGGLYLNVSGRMGFDAGDALGVNHPLPGESEGAFKLIWRSIGRWSIRRLDTVTVELDVVHVAPEYDKSLRLLAAKLPPIEIPLTVDPPRRSDEWLTPVVTEVFVKPTTNLTTLTTFLAESWKHGTVNVKATVGEMKITGGGKGDSWKANFHGMMKNIQTSISLRSE